LCFQLIEIINEFVFLLVKRVGIEPEIQGHSWEGRLCHEVEGDSEGILVGKHGRTLEALEIPINRMVNRRVKEPVRIVVDVGGYRNGRTESLGKLAGRLGERAKREGKVITMDPFSALERRIIHLALQQFP